MSPFPKALTLFVVCVWTWRFGRANEQCRTGTGRLVDGNTASDGDIEGYVEICFDSRWFRLCADGITTQDIEVACRHFGFTTGELLFKSTYSPGNSGSPFIQVTIVCIGSEEDLHGCDVGNPRPYVCPSSQDIAIRCSYDYVPFLDSAFIEAQSFYNPRNVEPLPGSLPFGNVTFNNFTVSVSGYVMFGDSKWPNTTVPSLPVAGDYYVLAPLWLQVSPTCFFLYPVSVATLNSQQGQGLPYLRQISNFIGNSTGNAFSATWMMVAQWKNVPVLCEPESNETGKFISFQAVVLTDEEDSYALFIYKCAPSLPRVSASVGFSTPRFFQTFRYSDSDNTTYLGCSNQVNANVPFFNLLYKLTDLENSPLSQSTLEHFSPVTLQNDSSNSTMEGPCATAGFNSSSCCQPFLDPTSSCRVDLGTHSSCYCDMLCSEINDCCADTNDQLVKELIQYCVPSVNPLAVSPSKYGGVEFPSAPPGMVDASFTPSPSSLSNSSNKLDVIVGMIAFALLVVTATLVISITVIIYRWRKKKKKEQAYLTTSFAMRKPSLLLSPLNHDPTDGNQLECPLITSQHPPRVSSEFTDCFSSDLIIHKDQLRLLDSVGRGEFGIVYKAHLFDFLNNSDITTVAVKTLKGNFDAEKVDELLRESLKMKQFSHPNVMELYGVCLDAGAAPFIVLPFMEGGSILQYLRSNRATYVLPELFEENDQITRTRTSLLAMCLQIAKGMEYLTSQNFVHRDLAARNCMISVDGHIKVADFGLSKAIVDKPYFRQDKMAMVKLPFKWMALESIEDGVFSEKTDVWSFGVTSWEIFSGGKTPYAGVRPSELPNMLTEGKRMNPPVNACCSGEIYRMIMFRCWKADSDKRPTFKQLVSDIGTALNYMADYLELNEMEAVRRLSATLSRYTTSLRQC